MRYSETFGSISSQRRPASFSLALLSHVHDSQAFRNMDMTRERISFTFDPRYMLLSFNIGFSFVRAAVACVILERTSGFEPLSEPIAPRYLKLVTVPSFCPLILISISMPLVLFRCYHR